MQERKLSLSLASFSDVGGREHNEDSLCTMMNEKTILLMVADGLGGYKFGEVASKEAVSCLQEKLSSAEKPDQKLMEAAIEEANRRILALHTDGRQMKTTIGALWLNGEAALASHVGDTRVYQFRNGGIKYQSLDHSMSQVAVMMGDITPDEIRGHEERNILIRALGSKENVKIETDELDIMPGDAFLLCSDGFWELIVEREMLDTLSKAKDAEDWMDKMKTIVAARYTADSDNNTAIAAMVLDC